MSNAIKLARLKVIRGEGDRKVSGTRFGRHYTARRVAKQGHGIGRGTCRCRHFYVGPSPAGMVTGGPALTIQRRRSAAVVRPIMLAQAYGNCDRRRSIALDRRALLFLPVFRPCREKADWPPLGDHRHGCLHCDVLMPICRMTDIPIPQHLPGKAGSTRLKHMA